MEMRKKNGREREKLWRGVEKLRIGVGKCEQSNGEASF
jgi:hypothetical protein